MCLELITIRARIWQSPPDHLLLAVDSSLAAFIQTKTQLEISLLARPLSSHV